MTRHRNKQPSQRQLRVGEEIRHALAWIIERGEIRDPVLQNIMVTVTEVSVSPDLKNATAYVIPLGKGLAGDFGSAGEGGAFDSAAFLKAMSRAAPYFRHELGRQVQLRYLPKLFFRLDTSFDQARHIDELLHDPAVARDLQKTSEEGEMGAELATPVERDPENGP